MTSRSRTILDSPTPLAGASRPHTGISAACGICLGSSCGCTSAPSWFSAFRGLAVSDGYAPLRRIVHLLDAREGSLVLAVVLAPHVGVQRAAARCRRVVGVERDERRRHGPAGAGLLRPREPVGAHPIGAVARRRCGRRGRRAAAGDETRETDRDDDALAEHERRTPSALILRSKELGASTRRASSLRQRRPSSQLPLRTAICPFGGKCRDSPRRRSTLRPRARSPVGGASTILRCPPSGV